jgi:hypothetical protein
MRETTTTGPAAGSGSDDKRIRELENTIDKLQVSANFDSPGECWTLIPTGLFLRPTSTNNEKQTNDSTWKESLR